MAAVPMSKPNALPWLWLSALLIGLDQATKWLAVASLPFQQQVEFVPGVWNWHLTHNTGAAFSFLANSDSAGLVLGAKVPVILTSRADSVRARIASCAVAVMAAHSRRQPPR
jgi:lipoprotein signal peptidase